MVIVIDPVSARLMDEDTGSMDGVRREAELGFKSLFCVRAAAAGLCGGDVEASRFANSG